MSTKNIKWQRLSSQTVWDKRMHIVEHSVVLPNGENSTYILEHGKGAVATIIVPKSGYVLLTYQYRFPLDKWIYDLPGGGMKESETPKKAAIRECMEETDVKPKKLVHLIKYFTNPARTDWPMHIFFCSEFNKARIITNDPSETVKKKILPLSQVWKMIDQGKIVDPSTLIGLHTARNLGLI